MTIFSKDYLIVLVEALFVTILWSSSWVIIKFGLEEVPPILFAGLRYSLGAFVLFIFIITKEDHRHTIKIQSKRWWILIAAYGIFFIAITQGGQFIALKLLPAITVSFVLNLTPFLVIFLSIILLKENPSRLELFFFLMAFIGLVFYFLPIDFSRVSVLALLVIFAEVISNAFSSILGRAVNRTKSTPPVIVTGLSMAIGSIILLLVGIGIDGIYLIFSLSLLSVFYIVWLAVVNTAIAFTIWNRVMQKLRAMDISIINSTMLPQIVILSMIFLGEMPLLKEWLGLGLIGISTLLVQFTQARRDSNQVL
ncbi:MAG: EamA family transporter [Candidatus Heimdallarchaeota archaeon]|nr:MAG: EamA family transporter [Candidatus Heimdallarchaeota archaeon]